MSKQQEPRTPGEAETTCLDETDGLGPTSRLTQVGFEGDDVEGPDKEHQAAHSDSFPGEEEE